MIKGNKSKKGEQRELLSVNAFAARLGVDEKTIRYHITEGHFPNGVTYDKDQVRKMDFVTASDEWLAFGGGQSRRTKAKSKQEFNDEDEPSTKRNKKFLEDINEARAKTEHFKAQTAELEYLELSKALVRRDDVYKEIFAKGVALREALLRVAGLVIDKVMTCEDRNENIITIQNAIETELARLTDEEINDNEDDEEAEA